MPKIIDLVGQRFQHLTVVKFIERKDRKNYYLCKCDCGNELVLSSMRFKYGRKVSCGCITERKGEIIDITDKRFGSLTALKQIGRKHKEVLWLCQCDCGNMYEATGYSLRSGHTTHCGCLLGKRIADSNKTHGLCDSRLYGIYSNMKTRCYNKNAESYQYYGGKGVDICEEWTGKNGFLNFYNWAFENGYKDDLSIDRINNSKNYEPTNCRWVTMKQQQNNRTNNRIFNVDGTPDTMANISDKLNIPYYKLQLLPDQEIYHLTDLLKLREYEVGVANYIKELGK